MRLIVRLLGLIVVIAVVLVGALIFLPKERLARIAADQIEAATGRHVSIDGGVSLTFWPSFGVRVEQFSLGNAEWASNEPMFEADVVDLGVDVMSLIGGNVQVAHLDAVKPVIRLEQKEDGEGNWSFSTAAAPQETSPTAPVDGTPPASADPVSQSQDSTARQFSIERMNVNDAELSYKTPGQETVRMSGVNLALAWPDPAGPAKLDLDLEPAGTPLSVSASVDAFASFLQGDVQGIEARLETASGAVTFKGRASLEGALDATVSLTTGDLQTFLAAFGVDPEATSGIGQAIDLETLLTVTPDLKVSLRGIDAKIDTNRLTGDADVSLRDVPTINARFDAGTLDLSGQAGQAPTRGAPSPTNPPATATNPPAQPPTDVAPTDADSGWSTAPIDASALSSFNGAIQLQADAVDLGDFDLGKTHVVMRNDNARMVIELIEVAAYGGRMTGEFVINNRNGLSVRGQLNAPNVQLQPLLTDAIDFDQLSGQGTLALAFLGVGESVDAIMRSLSGDGSLSVANGRFDGVNLDQLIDGKSGSGTTVFENLSASWIIREGIAFNNDLVFRLKRLEASGSGEIGLGTRTLDYTIVPEVSRVPRLDTLALPVRFHGPWSDVSIAPDLEEAVKLRINKELDPITRRATEELEEKLGLEAENAAERWNSESDKAADKLKKETDKAIRGLEEDAGDFLRKLFD